LLIDLDPQGTMSGMALRQLKSWIPKGQDSLATRAVSGDLELRAPGDGDRAFRLMTTRHSNR
jgi:hypothetical protein